MKPENFSKKIVRQLTYGLSLAKTINYTAQGALLPLVDKVADRHRKNDTRDFSEHLKIALPRVEKILKQDAENIASGMYPPQVIFQENLFTHYWRIPKLLTDAFRAARQRADKKSQEFETKDLDFVNEVPEYFRRNFHFQKGGYLNDESAALYDHQVEVLFSGTAQAMRRQFIPKLKKHFNNSDGEGLLFLEIGSGTGSLTRSIALAFPKAQITCLDISPHYLKHAQKNLSGFKRISYVQGLAEDLQFKENSFDAVFSCFLFHELPEKIRHQVIKEKMRVLKNNGLVAVIDSIQKDDDPALNWALDQFPVDYHEPFYKNYSEKKLEAVFNKFEIADTSVELAFLTKIVSGTKKVNT